METSATALFLLWQFAPGIFEAAVGTREINVTRVSDLVGVPLQRSDYELRFFKWHGAGSLELQSRKRKVTLTFCCAGEQQLLAC